MAEVITHNPKTPLHDDDVDGVAPWLAQAEANGWEGEHVFDASVEDPPHPFWDPVAGRCRPNKRSGKTV